MNTKRAFRVSGFGFLVIPIYLGSAQALTVTALGTTATQAILTYQAPDNNPCSISVSENSNLTPLVHDVDTLLFNGANLDTRPGSLTNGTTRVVVIGKRKAERAQDGKLYSRALQNNTKHYYQISCGSIQASGSFTTMAIPLGYTFNDPIPGDPNTPGNYAYPTMDPNNRNEEVIDPQTGLLIKHLSLPADKVQPAWSAAGFTDVCSPNMVPNESGAMGYHCLLGNPSQLYWINPITGDARILGILYPPAHLDMSDGNTFYSFNANEQNSGFPAIEKRIYHGQNQAAAIPSQNIPNCATGPQPCIEVQVMTPLTATGNIQTQFYNYLKQNNPDLTSDLFESYYGMGILWLQQGKIMLSATLNIQNTMSWIGAYDPTAGQMVAGMSTFHKGMRWCGLHTTIPVGDIPWFGVGGQNLWGTAQSTTTGNNLGPGSGPYLVHVAAAMTNQPGPCPPNAFGITGNQCTSIQVDGEPCNPHPFLGDHQLPTPESTSPKCANPTWGYAQDAQPGDVLFTWNESPSSNGEYIRLLVKNGTSWVIQRGYGTGNFPKAHPAGDGFVMSCGYVDTFFDRYWDFVDDPTGTNANGLTMPHDVTGTGGHSAYRPNAFVDQGYTIRNGPMPDVLSAPSQFASDHPSFAQVDPGTYDSEFTLESHPTYPYSNKWFLDGRPLVGGRSTNPPSATGALVSGQLYKYTTSAYGAQGGAMPLNPQQVPTVASCGNHVLQDISGPTAAIGTDNSSLYQYCLTRKPGECRPGSNAGELYVNCPNRASTTCIFPGWGNGGDGLEDMCVGNSEAYTMNLIQFGYSPLDNSGRESRALTHGFVQYRRENVFWNVRALPDGSWMLFNLSSATAYGPWSQMGFLAKLPPYTGYDGVARNDLIQIPVQLTPPPGVAVNNAVIQFGYAENGANNQYYCTSRQEACLKGSQPGRQYGYAADSIPGVSCASGCTVTIPAVPQHMVYFQALYRDASGNVVAKGTAQAVASEPPFLIAGVPLTVAVAAPVSGLVTGSVPLTAAITGSASIAHVDYFVDNNLVGSTTTVPYTYNWDSTSVSSGYHTITVKAYDTSGNVAVSAPVTVTVTCNNIPSNSFQGCYYDDSNSTPGSFSQLLLSRTDPAVSFSWNSNPPSPLFPNYQYSVRWKGNMQFNADTYAFNIAVNYLAQTRLWIDGKLVIDAWIPLSPSTGTITFATAGTHLVQIDYANANTNGWGSIFLNWTASHGPQAPPFAPDLTVTAIRGLVSDIQLHAVDAATTTLTYSIVTGSQHGGGAQLLYGSHIFYTTPAAYLGPDTVTYKANDGVFDSNIGTIHINVVDTQPIVISPITTDATDIDPGTPGLQINPGTSMLLSATAADAANNPITWQWSYTIDGGPENLLSTGDGAVQSIHFTVPTITSATYQVILQVQDMAGNTANQNLTMTTGGGAPPPSPTVVLNANPQQGIAPLVVAFDASQSHSPNGAITSYSWNFGDGVAISTTQSKMSHTYNSAGDFAVSVIVTDVVGAKASNSTVIHVTLTNPSPGPVAAPTFTPAGGNFSGTLSVQIQDTTAGAFIYYTTDGTNPTLASTLYSVPIGLNASTAIRAIAYANGNLSTVASAIFTQTGQAGQTLPSIDPTSIPTYAGLGDSLSINNYPISNAEFIWTFTPVGGTPYPASPGIFPAAGSASFKSGAKTNSLSSYGLGSGVYQVTVQAQDNLGDTSPPLMRSVTLLGVLESDFSGIRLYPNPWRKDKHTGPIVFDHLPIGSSVKIFTISGLLVKSLTPNIDTAKWDLTNDSNQNVGSGIYIYLLTMGNTGYGSNGQKASGKLAVIR